ncbi:hypothetical protein D3C78_816100 [compost metagenome]
MVEKRLGSGEHRRPPWHFPVADHANPLALHHGLDDVAVDRNTPHVLDLATGDGLAVSDQGHGFEQRTGIALRAFFPQAAHPRREIVANLQAIAAGHFLELEGPTTAGFAEHLQGFLEYLRLRALGLLEQLVQPFKRLRFA